MEKDRVLAEIREAIELNRTVKQKNNDALSHAEYLLKREDEYNRGLNDAWELTQKIWLPVACGGMETNVIAEVFGYECYELPMHYTPQEALGKLEAYEKSKKEVEEKFKVGDIITFEDGTKGMVMDIDAVDNVAIFTDNGCIEAWIGQEQVTKTGKHIDISALLEEIGEE